MLNPDARPELLRVAKRMVWCKPPEETLADPVLFLSYAMTDVVPVVWTTRGLG